MPGSTQPLWEVRAFGTLDTAGTTPVTPETPFRISSLSKLVGSVLALDMVAEGRLALDDNVSRWLPGLGGVRVLASPYAPLSVTVPTRSPVTLRHLLTFTAGFGSDFG